MKYEQLDVILNTKRVESVALHTVLPVLGLTAAYLIASSALRNYSGPSIAMFMMLGIWALASTATMIGASFFERGGFSASATDSIIVIALGLLPPYAVIMSTYDGSIFGLFSTVLLMLGAHVLFERDRWKLPPSVRDWLRRYEYNPSAAKDR